MSERPDCATLETERLVLEPLAGSHAAELFPLLSDPRVFEFIPQDPPSSQERLAATFTMLEGRLSPDGRDLWLNWVVRVKEGGVCVGRVEATLYPDATAYFAYTFGAEHWGRGYGTEACRRVVEALFGQHGVESIRAEVDTRNTASIRLLERLGFRKGEVKRGAQFFKGSSSDEITYSLRRP